MIEKKTSKVWITVPSEKKCRALKLFPSTHSLSLLANAVNSGHDRSRWLLCICSVLCLSLFLLTCWHVQFSKIFSFLFFSINSMLFIGKKKKKKKKHLPNLPNPWEYILMRRLHGQHIQRKTSKKLTSAIGACDTVCSSVDPPNNVQLFYPAVLWLLQQCLDSERALKLQKLQNRSARMTIVSRLTLPFRPPTARASLIQAFLFCQRRLWFLLLGFLGVTRKLQTS